RQTLYAAGIRQEPTLHFGQLEIGVLGHDDDVRRERKLEAAAHGGAVYGGDDRLGEVPELGEAGEPARSVREFDILVQRIAARRGPLHRLPKVPPRGEDT